MIDVKERKLFNKGYFISSLEADNNSCIKRFEGPAGMCPRNRWIENFPIDDYHINKLYSIEFDHFIDSNPDRFDKIIIHFDNDTRDYFNKLKTFDELLNEFWRKYSLFSDILNTVAESGYHTYFHIYEKFKTTELMVQLRSEGIVFEESASVQSIDFSDYYEEIIMQLRKLLRKVVDGMEDDKEKCEEETSQEEINEFHKFMSDAAERVAKKYGYKSDSIDIVNHPAHYESGKFECIEVMQEVMGAEAVKDFCICNVFKYVYRHKNKNGLEDLKKAKWYLDKYLELSKEEKSNKG